MGERLGAPVLRGRRDELRAVQATLDQAARGNLRAVLIEGEPGIGKSRLLADAVAGAAESGLQVFRGRSDELARAQPFAALAEALSVRTSSDDQRKAKLASALSGPLSEVSAPLPEAGPQFQIVDAFVDLVESAALERPAVVALDDVHWADPGTTLAVSGLAERLGDLPVALVLAYRPWPMRRELERLLERLISEQGAVELRLTPLPDREILAIAGDLLGHEPDEHVVDLLSRTNGNPLYVVELLRALSENGAAGPEATNLPPSLRMTILRRLSVLPEPSLRVLRAACILGSVFSVEDVGIVLSQSPIELYPQLDHALRLGVLEQREKRLAFRHDLIREALYEDMPSAVRTALHRDSARALAAAGAPPLRVAEQFILSASPGDDETLQWLREAAAATAPRSTQTAIDLLERALELTSPGSTTWSQVAAELIVLLAVAGRPEEGEALSQQVSTAGMDPKLEGAFRIGIAEAVWNRGDLAGARENFELGAALPREADPHRSIAAAFAGQLAVMQGDLAGAKEACRSALEAADPAVKTVVDAVVAETRAIVHTAEGRFEAAVDEARCARDLTPTVESEWAAYLYPHIYLALALNQADEFEQAAAAVLAGRQRAELMGNVSWLPMYQWVLTSAYLWQGKWEDAVAEAEAGIALASEVSNTIGIVFGYSMMGHIAIYRGDLEEAERQLAASERALEQTGPGLGADFMIWGRGLLHEARGEIPEALEAMQIAWEVSEAVRYLLGFRTVAPRLVRLALREDERELADAVALAVATGAERTKVASVHAADAHCRALLGGDPDALVRAVEMYRATPRPLELAQACEDAAELLAEGGRGSEATELLEEALSAYEGLGASLGASRVAARLRELGVRRGARGPRRRATTGWEALTPTEERVAALAGQRLTNKEIGEQLFVSSRTVQTHLKHIFQKLEIGSRRELADHLPAGAAGSS